jgi:hypothetical protein
MDETAINASLDACLHGAREGDVNHARQLHYRLGKALTEQETDEGRLWLTDHARMLLADVHRQLSHCEETGKALSEHVLVAVSLRPRVGQWPDPCNFVANMRVALAVANELCQQSKAGCTQDLDQAVAKVAEAGEYGTDAAKIRRTYDEIVDAVEGFREMTRC